MDVSHLDNFFFHYLPPLLISVVWTSFDAFHTSQLDYSYNTVLTHTGPEIYLKSPYTTFDHPPTPPLGSAIIV